MRLELCDAVTLYTCIRVRIPLSSFPGMSAIQIADFLGFSQSLLANFHPHNMSMGQAHPHIIDMGRSHPYVIGVGQSHSCVMGMGQSHPYVMGVGQSHLLLT